MVLSSTDRTDPEAMRSDVICYYWLRLVEAASQQMIWELASGIEEAAAPNPRGLP
jgi:hypothetical protein